MKKVWLILDGTGYPIEVFSKEQDAYDYFTNYHLKLGGKTWRILEMFMDYHTKGEPNAT